MRAPDDVLHRALSNRIFELTLMPTEACNFRCTYCYEDFALGRMSPELVLGVKAWMTQRAAQLDELHVAWFGGEPLLALDIVRDVQRHVRELEQRHPGLATYANMTTNAWKLSPDVFAELVGLGVERYQISFDGPPAVHDAKRKRLDGKPTFERIWRNVRAMKDTDLRFQVILRVHVDHENVDVLPELTDRIQAEFGCDPRFEILLKPISRYGGPNDATLPVLEGDEDARRFARLHRHVFGEPKPLATGPTSPKTCYASKGNSHVVRSDGRLCKCTVVLDHPANQVGRLRADGTVEIDPARARPWMRGLFSGNVGELLCPMIGIEAAAAV